MTEPCFQGEQEDRDETTVFCLSEANKPTYSNYGHVFTVHAVFKSGNHWYAYVGYSATHKAHMYISLTSNDFILTVVGNFPMPVVILSDPLSRVEHTASVKIGQAGTLYVKYDYLINGDKLYRFMGLNEDGKFFKYAKYTGGDDIDFIEVKTKLRNYAKQVVCEK
mgnify:FL=1